MIQDRPVSRPLKMVLCLVIVAVFAFAVAVPAMSSETNPDDALISDMVEMVFELRMDALRASTLAAIPTGLTVELTQRLTTARLSQFEKSVQVLRDHWIPFYYEMMLASDFVDNGYLDDLDDLLDYFRVTENELGHSFVLSVREELMGFPVLNDFIVGIVTIAMHQLFNDDLVGRERVFIPQIVPVSTLRSLWYMSEDATQEELVEDFIRVVSQNSFFRPQVERIVLPRTGMVVAIFSE